MTMKSEIYFSTRAEFHDWLQKNGKSSGGIWIIMYKKHTGRQCILYADAVEEALCFGWIDGKLKRINDEYYVQYYAPRRPGSRWSKLNTERVEKLIREGRMKPEGLNAYNEVSSKPNLVYDNRARVKSESEIPEELLAALKENSTAFDNFMKFTPSARRIYVEWFRYAKRDKTRVERIKKIVSFSERNIRPGII